MFKKRHIAYDYRQVFLDFNRSIQTIKDTSLMISSIVSRIYELIPAKAVYLFWENNDETGFQLMNFDAVTQTDLFVSPGNGSSSACTVTSASPIPPTPPTLSPGDGLVQWLKLNEKPLIVSFDPEYDNIFSSHDKEIINYLKAVLICPLKTSNRFKGAIMMQERADSNPYSSLDLEMLSILLDNAVLAIENVAYYEERVTHLKHIYQTDRLAVIGQLAAGAAHEIRNPLTSIKSIIQYVKDDIKEDKKQLLMKTVLQEVDRINDILTGLLSFSRQNNPVKHKFDLAVMIDQTLDFIRNTKMKKRITLTATFYTPTIFIVADHDQLKQVLMNIVLNAMDAIDEAGEVEVDVRQAKMEGRPCITITVTDTGKGIEDESLEKLFDPFYTTKTEGTGLGLSISYGIIRQHQGNIEIGNRPNGGARVTINIPC
jgi:signal transduction histidine kinase